MKRQVRGRFLVFFATVILLFISETPCVWAQATGGDMEVFPQLGHEEDVVSVVYSPDGKHIASGSYDQSIKIWEADSGRLIRTVATNYRSLDSVAYSPDGKQIVSKAPGGTIKTWDAATGREIRTFKAQKEISSVVYSPDGKYIASRSYGGTITIWEAATGREIKTFVTSSYSGKIVYSPDGKYIVGDGDSNASSEIKIWEAATGKELRTFKGLSVAYSPDGKYIAFDSSENTIKIQDAVTGREMRTFATQKSIRSVRYSPDGKYIASRSWDGAIRRGAITIWEAATGREISAIVVSSYSGGITYSPDGKCIAGTGDSNKSIKIWEVATGKERKTLGSYSNSYISVAYSPDGKYFALGEKDGFKHCSIKIWNAAEGREIRTLAGHSTWIAELKYSPDGKYIASGSGDNTIKIWDAESGRELRTLTGHSKSPYDFPSAVGAVAYSPDGKYIASGARDNTIKIWDAASGREIRTIPGHNESVNSVAYSPDGKYIVSGSNDMSVKIWDVATGKNIRILNGHRANVYSVAYSFSGKYIASGSHDKTIKIWDAASGQEIRTITGHSERVDSVVFSSDGKYIASGSWDNTIKIWDAASGQEIRTFKGHSNVVTSVAFSPDGKRIVSGSQDGTTRIWDAATGAELALFISFSGSDTQIAAATRDISVEVAGKASSLEGEWLSITPDGYYQSSPRGDRYLNVRVGNTVSGIDSYRSIFYNPDVVQARLNGQPDPSSKASVTIQQAASFAPPTVTVQAANSTTTSGTTTISVAVSDRNQSLKAIKVFVNGTVLGRDDLSKASGAGLRAERSSFTVTGGLKEVKFNLPVPLEPGDNLIEVTAFNGNADNRSSANVVWQTSQKLPPPNLWILAIGVNKYDDPRINSLNFCVSDAAGIIESFKAQEGKRYTKVNALLVADNAGVTPTAANIRDKLKWLDQAGPRDVIVLFLAGHGITQGNKFYFLPKDGAIKSAGLIDTARAVSDTDILSTLDAPGKRLIFIDACHSGGVDNNLITRALMESNGLVFTASQGNELSNEFDDLQHGVFTYSIMQGLGGRYNARTERDIKILPLSVSVSDFVAKEVERKSQNARSQHPKVYSLGFPELTIAVN